CDASAERHDRKPLDVSPVGVGGVVIGADRRDRVEGPDEAPPERDVLGYREGDSAGELKREDDPDEEGEPAQDRLELAAGAGKDEGARAAEGLFALGHSARGYSAPAAEAISL